MRTDSVDVDANSTDADVTSLSAKAIFIPIRILCLYSLIPNNPRSQWILYQNFTRSAHSYTGPGLDTLKSFESWYLLHQTILELDFPLPLIRNRNGNGVRWA